MVALRQANLEDHVRVLAVVDEWWGGRRMSALIPSLFLEHFAGTSYVAEDSVGALSGFLIGFRSQDRPDEAYVHFVGVRPDQRGTGLGARLHDTFATTVQERGVRRIRCVTSRLNTASIAFHTSIGFVVDGTDAPIDAVDLDDTAGHVRLVRELA